MSTAWPVRPPLQCRPHLSSPPSPHTDLSHLSVGMKFDIWILQQPLQAYHKLPSTPSPIIITTLTKIDSLPNIGYTPSSQIFHCHPGPEKLCLIQRSKQAQTYLQPIFLMYITSFANPPLLPFPKVFPKVPLSNVIFMMPLHHISFDHGLPWWQSSFHCQSPFLLQKVSPVNMLP